MTRYNLCSLAQAENMNGMTFGNFRGDIAKFNMPSNWYYVAPLTINQDCNEYQFYVSEYFDSEYSAIKKYINGSKMLN